MFRIFAAVLFTIFSCYAAGQDTVNMKDSQGRKQGFWRKADSAGHVVYDGHFKDGIPAGIFHYYYPDGKLKTLSVVTNRGKLAMTTSYFPNGRKMAAGRYLNEKKDSTWQFFSETAETLVSEENYKNGLAEGVSKVYYPEGGLSEQRTYKNGIPDGPWEQYYTEGKLKLKGGYQAGEKHGALKTFFISGQVMMSGQYVSGHQAGTWLFYNDKGAIAKKETYLNGRLVKVEAAGK